MYWAVVYCTPLPVTGCFDSRSRLRSGWTIDRAPRIPDSLVCGKDRQPEHELLHDLIIMRWPLNLEARGGRANEERKRTSFCQVRKRLRRHQSLCCIPRNWPNSRRDVSSDGLHRSLTGLPTLLANG